MYIIKAASLVCNSVYQGRIMETLILAFAVRYEHLAPVVNIKQLISASCWLVATGCYRG